MYQTYNTDALEWLGCREPRSIHAIVTDPPYGIVEYLPDQLQKKRNGNGGIWRLPHNYGGVERSPMPRFTVLRPIDHERISRFHSQLAKLAYEVLVPGAHVIMASQSTLSHLVIAAFTSSGFQMRGQIARIVKTLRGGDRPKGAHTVYPNVSVSPRSCWEPWLIFRKPCEGRVRDNLEKWETGALRRPAIDKPFSDLVTSGPARGAERQLASHPSLKPQAFVRQIVWAALPLGRGILLDPFMGSGSTIAAALYLGYESIGIEIDPEYFTMAQSAIPALAALQVNGSPEPVTQPRCSRSLSVQS
jgi:site-specific DNA-methyltransferase (adenine-specific)